MSYRFHYQDEVMPDETRADAYVRIKRHFEETLTAYLAWTELLEVGGVGDACFHEVNAASPSCCCQPPDEEDEVVN